MSIEKIEKLKNSLNILTSNKGKVFFFVPNVSTPSSAVYEIYFHANVLKNDGRNVVMLIEDDFQTPIWIESSLLDIKHESIEKTKLSVAPEDIMIIPEIYTNIMEQTRNLPCIRITLVQSVDFMLNGLVNGSEYSEFGIENLIVASERIKDVINNNFGRFKYNIESYKIGIPDYFKKSNKLKKPIISIIGRNQNEMGKIVKLFYLKYPQYSWVTFDPMITNSNPPQQLDRQSFAERLSENFATVWVDRISSFGTLPLEAMRVGNIVIGLIPDLAPEYLFNEENKFILESGSWVENIYDLPSMIAETLSMYLDDSISQEQYNTMYDISMKYTQENSKTELLNIYKKFINDRVVIIERTIKQLENNIAENNEK